MKIWFVIFLFFTTNLPAQENNASNKRVNFFIFDNPKHKKITSQTFWFRAKWHAYLSKGKMVAFRATSPNEAANKLQDYIVSHKVNIGTLWFDSHGYYWNRLSSFYFGGSRINYNTIKDTINSNALNKISLLCDGETKIIIGACFSTATFNFPDRDSLKGRPMKGDSLFHELNKIFTKSTIYGCQSWVMESFGLWHSKYNLAGAPIDRMYMDKVFEPAWQRLGSWRKMNPMTKQLENCNTIALNKKGTAFEKANNFNSFKKVQKKIKRKIPKLKIHLYKNKLRIEE